MPAKSSPERVGVCVQKLYFTKYLSEYRNLSDYYLLYGKDKSDGDCRESLRITNRAVCYDLRIRKRLAVFFPALAANIAHRATGN